MDKANKLIDLIDNELLKLHEASIHKGEYYHFNFKQALINLNREFLKNGLYDKSNYVNSNHSYEQIVRNYRDVFNDLSNFRTESIHFRYMSFDPKTGELEIEQITRNELNQIVNRELYKKPHYTLRGPEEIDENVEELQAALDGLDKYLRADIIAANAAAEKAIVEDEDEDKAEAVEAFKYYSNLKYPEDNYRELSRTCKFDYLLRDCSVKYDRLGIVNYSNQSDSDLFYFDNIDLFFMCITNGVSFDMIFGHSIQVGFIVHFDVNRSKISFEDYIKSLQADRFIESNLIIEYEIQRENNLSVRVINNVNIENIVHPNISIPENEIKKDSISEKDEFDKTEIIVNLLIPKHINRDQTEDLKKLLNNGRLLETVIKINGKYQNFHNVLFPFYNIIPTKYQKSWYDFIQNNFTFKGKDISKSTISSAKINQIID